MAVKSFKDPMELFEEMRRNKERADQQIEGWQRSIRPPAKVIRIAEAAGKLLLIYGSIIDPVESERAHYNLNDPMDAAEFQFVEQRFGSDWQRSFRFGRFYSPLCVEGEFGQIHLATITGVLTEAEFKAAQEQEWPQDFTFAKAVYERRSSN